MKVTLVVCGSLLLVTAIAMMIPVGGQDLSAAMGSRAREIDRPDGLPDSPPGRPLDLVFLHHSIGGQWLAQPGPEDGDNCLYQTHPNGGGLRKALEAQGYIVHEASFGSRVAEDTDFVHWPPKFRERMDEILTCRRQDDPLPDGQRNRVVMFKSCYPNSGFIREGIPPGKADSPEKTVENAKAVYAALLEEFARHPDVLYLSATAPPLCRRSSLTRSGRRWRGGFSASPTSGSSSSPAAVWPASSTIG